MDDSAGRGIILGLAMGLVIGAVIIALLCLESPHRREDKRE